MSTNIIRLQSSTEENLQLMQENTKLNTKIEEIEKKILEIRATHQEKVSKNAVLQASILNLNSEVQKFQSRLQDSEQHISVLQKDQREQRAKLDQHKQFNTELSAQFDLRELCTLIETKLHRLIPSKCKTFQGMLYKLSIQDQVVQTALTNAGAEFPWLKAVEFIHTILKDEYAQGDRSLDFDSSFDEILKSIIHVAQDVPEMGDFGHWLEANKELLRAEHDQKRFGEPNLETWASFP